MLESWSMGLLLSTLKRVLSIHGYFQYHQYHNLNLSFLNKIFGIILVSFELFLYVFNISPFFVLQVSIFMFWHCLQAISCLTGAWNSCKKAVYCIHKNHVTLELGNPKLCNILIK